MSGPLINRSLTTIRTELEFLHDSEVITEELYNKLLEALPTKYRKDDKPWGVDKLGVSDSVPAYDAPPSGPPPSSTDKLSQEFAKTSITNNVQPPSQPPRSFTPKPLGYCKALYDYAAAETDDLALRKGDKIAVVEHLSEDWWKGYKQGGSADKTGVFPSNYVNVISEQEFNSASSDRAGLPPPAPQQEEKAASYRPGGPYSPGPGYQPSPPQYNQPLQQQPSYGGYAQFPPPSTNFYPSPQPQQVVYAAPQPTAVAQPQQQEQHSTMHSIGSKFGNAAIFGAGATLGGDLINSIF